MDWIETVKDNESSTFVTDDFFSFDELRDEYPELSVSDWKSLARGINISPQWRLSTEDSSRRANGRRRIQGLTSDEIQRIEIAYAPRHLTDDEVTVSRLSQQYKLAPKTIRNIGHSIGIEPCIYIFRKVHRVEAYTSEQLKYLLPLIEKRIEAKATKDITPISHVLREYQLHVDTLNAEIDRLGLDVKEYQFGSAFGRGLTPQDLIALEPFLSSRKNQQASADITSEFKLLEKLGIGVDKLEMLKRETGVVPEKYRFRGVLGNGYTQEQVDQMQRLLQERSSVDALLINTLARQNHIAYETLYGLITKAGVVPRDLLFSSNGRSLGKCISSDDLEAVQKYYSDFEQFPFADDNVFSLREIARQCRSTFKTIKKLVDATDVSPEVYRFGRGKNGLGLSREQIAKVAEIYSPFTRPER